MASVSSESLLTKLTMIIELITSQTNQAGSTTQSKYALLKKINEFKDMLSASRQYAQSLEGGQLTIAEQDDIIAMLEQMKYQKRNALSQAMQGIDASNTYHDMQDMEVDSMASTPVAQ